LQKNESRVIAVRDIPSTIPLDSLTQAYLSVNHIQRCGVIVVNVLSS